jgi:hypothetical protein
VRGPSEYLKLAERGASMHGFNVMQACRRGLLSLFLSFFLFSRPPVGLRRWFSGRRPA